MRLVWLVLAAAACGSAGGDDYPVLPGGNGPPIIGGRIDAAVVDAPLDAFGGTILGHVCVLTDLRDVASCAELGVDGLTVTLGTATATTAANGSFSLTAPTGTNLTWHVSGPNIEPSVQPLGPTANLFAIATTTYDALLGANGLLRVQGNGAVFLQVVHAGAPIVGATATATPPSTDGPYYDGISATTWDQDATGAFGMVWFFGAPAGDETLTISPPAANPDPIVVPIEADAITFAALAVP